MNAVEKELRIRNLRLLAVLAGLFLLPLAGAFFVYYGTDWRPIRTVNHGELIAPARPLPPTRLPLAVGPDAAQPATTAGAASNGTPTAADTAPADATAHAASEGMPAGAGGLNTAPTTELFRHKWSLVYIGDGQCDESCRFALYFMRQTRLSLNNEMPRVERIFLAPNGCCAREFLTHEHP